MRGVDRRGNGPARPEIAPVPRRPEPAGTSGTSHTAAPRRWAVIAGGGTGGHVMPALAVGQALVAAGHDPATIHFVGAKRGIEAKLVPEAGFGITLLPGRGIARKL